MKYQVNLSVALLLLVQWLAVSQCAQILMLSPMGTRSHMYSFMPIMEALAERGHNITTVTPHEPKTKSPNIKKITISEIAQHLEADWQKFERDSIPIGVKNFITELVTLQSIGYEIMMKNSQIQEIMRNKNVDLVIVDAIMNEFTFPFIDYLGVPFIFHSAATGTPWSLAAFDIPNDYARIPSVVSDFKSEMTFFERLANMLSVEILLFFRKMYVLPILDNLARNDFPNSRPIKQIERSAQLCLASHHPTTAWPRILPQIFVPIGALHVRPPQPLPDDLKTFADGAEHGFIVFTLGSNARVSQMPENIKTMFINVFARIPQRVFWKWEKESMESVQVSSNVKMIDWLPQQDLIGHEKARLFISHGGLLGTQETIYHGVPILGLPLGRDQKSNLAKSEEEGYGIKIDWGDLTEPLLYDSIQKLLHEPSYRGNASRLSRIMRDELVPAKDAAAYWVEHVLRHGTQHLQFKVKDMPFYKVYLLDIWLFLIAIFTIPPIVLFKIIKFCMRRKSSNKKGKTE